MCYLHVREQRHNLQQLAPIIYYSLVASHFTDPERDANLCQARLHRELNLGSQREHARMPRELAPQPSEIARQTYHVLLDEVGLIN